MTEVAGVRVVLRPLGTPLPLGFIGLSGATTVLSAQQLGFIDAGESHFVGLVIVAFAVPLQLVASVFGFLSRDTVAGTGMGILVGSWLSIGLVTLVSPPGGTSEALGVLLLLAGAAMLIPASAAALGKVVVAGALVTTSVRFGLTGLYELTASPGVEVAAGVAGLLLAALALYAALAAELEDMARRPVLPLGRRGDGRAAMEGGIEDQARGLEREAGVREQL
jgi:succinate-acetate transporter protein